VLDTQEGVYIPPGVTRAAGLVAGEYRMITLIPNNPERESNTKWMGVFAQPAEEEPRSTVQGNINGLLDALGEGYLTTNEAAKELGVTVVEARDILNKLFNERKLARADVHFGSNKRAQNVLWAKDPESFL